MSIIVNYITFNAVFQDCFSNGKLICICAIALKDLLFFLKILKNFFYCAKLVQAMKKIPVTTELLQRFRANPQTLILEGYCVNFDNVTVYNDGSSYALTVLNHLGITECCIFTEQTAFIDEVLAILCGNVKFCGVSTFVADYLKSRFDVTDVTDCTLYAWDGEQLDTRVIDCEISQSRTQYATQ